MSDEWLDPIAKLYVQRVAAESDIQDHMPRLKVLVEQIDAHQHYRIGDQAGIFHSRVSDCYSYPTTRPSLQHRH